MSLSRNLELSRATERLELVRVSSNALEDLKSEFSLASKHLNSAFRFKFPGNENHLNSQTDREKFEEAQLYHNELSDAKPFEGFVAEHRYLYFELPASKRLSPLIISILDRSS
jgi:hypothetical protein